MPKKHQIAYVKPEEPSFLKKLKEQAGYKEGPTVDTKREDLGGVDPGDFEDTEEEQPQVVVLRPGDLTAQEVACEKLRLNKEEEEKPVDLSSAVFTFKKPRKRESKEIPCDSQQSKEDHQGSTKRSLDSKEKKSKKLKNSRLLSFNDDEGEQE